MVDYQEMYYKMNRAMEKAINILVEAQRECEEEYLKQTDPPDDGDCTERKQKQQENEITGKIFETEAGICPPSAHYEIIAFFGYADYNNKLTGRMESGS